MTKERPEKNGRGLLIGILIALAILILLIAGYFAYELFLKPAEEPRSRDADALQGRVQQLTEQEIQDELNRIVEEGMFNISIASVVVVYGKEQTAEFRIENKEANRYLMQVTVTLDDTHEIVYKTGIIDPGYYIPSAQLQKRLEPGEYAATAVFTALYPDDESVVGTAGAQIELYVLPDTVTPPPQETPVPTKGR